MKRRIAAVMSALVVVSVTTTAIAACAAGTLTAENAQMACCKAGHHKCGPKGSPTDCCKKNETRQHQWTSAKTEPITASDHVAVLFVMPVDPAASSAILQHARFESVLSPPRLSGPPVYLINSTLLI